MENNLLPLKERIFKSAEIFIEDMGEFVPFGIKQSEGILKDVMAITENEGDDINGIEYVTILKNSFEKGFFAKNIEAAGIAYDVLITVNNEKRDALCLITSIDGVNWTEESFLYKIIEGKCVWG